MIENGKKVTENGKKVKHLILKLTVPGKPGSLGFHKNLPRGPGFDNI